MLAMGMKEMILAEWPVSRIAAIQAVIRLLATD